jgi:hypothetical protein
VGATSSDSLAGCYKTRAKLVNLKNTHEFSKIASRYAFGKEPLPTMNKKKDWEVYNNELKIVINKSDCHVPRDYTRSILWLVSLRKEVEA